MVTSWVPGDECCIYIGDEILPIYILGGGFKDFLFSPLPGEMIQFDSYFSDGLKRPPSIGDYYYEP